MLSGQQSYPFHRLSIEDAQRIWQLAEEDHERRSTSVLMANPGHDFAKDSPLLLAVRALSRNAYRELIALACLGRGRDTSFDSKRVQAEAEVSHDYLGLDCPHLHCYLRRALGTFGVPPLHKPNQANYPAEITDEDITTR